MAAKKQSAFMKPLQPDEALAALVGNKPLPRSEVIKKIWAYVKRKGLQDKLNRRAINTDETLAAIFAGKKQITMFEVGPLAFKHLK